MSLMLICGDGIPSSFLFQKFSSTHIFKNFHLLNRYLVKFDESFRLWYAVIDGNP